ncbi:hypothetical protein E9232_000692 [Inquilinus ginsengisoli]|uniref:Uncharacterized protein n=1 Tax=Inquilinus ginsengisoli TaxID=363840 RepID=A0ABU1JHY9_9PROT|nr:hypothetical protein [Inquilinus ginsengisoli]MDR6288193.1 hypothetical protein [Inquilinus ginsengisoli]
MRTIQDPTERLGIDLPVDPQSAPVSEIDLDQAGLPLLTKRWPRFEPRCRLDNHRRRNLDWYKPLLRDIGPLAKLPPVKAQYRDANTMTALGAVQFGRFGSKA